MSAGFDPYHKLLGIPPEEQPPNYYRLLGLTQAFENDVEVIENCANRVMQSLKQHQLGNRGPEIAKLLNEVTSARLTLLNPVKKLAYDERLRRSGQADSGRDRTRRNDVFLVASPQEQYQARRFLMWGALVIVVLACGCIGYFFAPGLRGGSDREVAINEPVPMELEAKTADPTQNAVAALKGKKSEFAGQSLEAPSVAGTASEVQTRLRESQLLPVSSGPLRPDQASPGLAERDHTSGDLKHAETSKTVADPESTTGPSVSQIAIPMPETGEPGSGTSPLAVPLDRDPVNAQKADVENTKVNEPAISAQETAATAIRARFKSDLQKAKRPAEKLALALNLKAMALIEAPDSAMRFVLLEQASSFAASAGDPQLALDTLDELAATFDVDVFRRKAEALKTLGKLTKEPDKLILLLDLLSILAVQLAEQEKYPDVMKLCAIQSSIGSRLKVRPIVDEANELKQVMLERQEQFFKVQAARNLLLTNPTSLEARRIVGGYLCLTRHDWNAGISLLRQCSDEQLSSMAEYDFADATNPVKQRDLALSWLELSRSGPNHARAGYADRAVQLLTLVMEKTKGIDQLPLQKALREAIAIRDWDQPFTQLLANSIKAIEQNRLSKTVTITGEASEGVLFEEMPSDPGVLVGFDVRMRWPAASAATPYNGHVQIEIIRPIFLTAVGLSPADIPEQDLEGRTKIVQLRARQGYAVSGLRLAVTSVTHNLSVQYRKMTIRGLDEAREYWSERLGPLDFDGRSPSVVEIKTETQPIVGVTGARTKAYERQRDGRRLLATGFITAEW